MKPEQEPKYTTDENGRIVNRKSGERIPDDEPVMIFRARDVHAAAAILHYASLCQDADHRDIVRQRADDFRAFASAHPDRMKEPDSP